MHETSENTIVERSFRVKNKFGLHARPAALIARTAQRFKAQIWIIDRNKKADAKSILDILCLAVPYRAAITTLDDLFQQSFDETTEQG
jgi:phosphocarrier protein